VIIGVGLGIHPFIMIGDAAISISNGISEVKADRFVIVGYRAV